MDYPPCRGLTGMGQGRSDHSQWQSSFARRCHTKRNAGKLLLEPHAYWVRFPNSCEIALLYCERALLLCVCVCVSAVLIVSLLCLMFFAFHN